MDPHRVQHGSDLRASTRASDDRWRSDRAAFHEAEAPCTGRTVEALTKKLTPKELGLVDDVKLSTTFANSRRVFKTVNDSVLLGYYVAGGGRVPVMIAPIYRADVWVRVRGHRAVYTSHEVGPYLNPILTDPTGNAIAQAVYAGLVALESHALEHGSAKSKARGRAKRPARKRTEPAAAARRGTPRRP
jgi:hypothetical protein